MKSKPETIATLEQLYAHYGDPVPAALIKELPSVSEHYCCFSSPASALPCESMDAPNSASTQIPRTALPTVAEMMTAITQGAFDGNAYDEAYPERLRQTIY